MSTIYRPTTLSDPGAAGTVVDASTRIVVDVADSAVDS